MQEGRRTTISRVRSCKMAVTQIVCIAVFFSFSGVVVAFACPFIFMAVVVPKKGLKWTSDLLDRAISGIAGMGLANWIARMVPFDNMLHDAVGLKLPTDGAALVIGLFIVFLLDAALVGHQYVSVEEVVEQSSRGSGSQSERFVHFRRAHTYLVRPLSSEAYTKILATALAYAACEGFNMSIVLTSTDYKLFYSAMVHEMLLALFLAVSCLRTPYSTLKTIKTGLLFASAMPLGILSGVVLGDVYVGLYPYVVLHVVASLSSGAFVILLFDHFVLPELKSGRLRRLGYGAIICLLLVYPTFNL